MIVLYWMTPDPHTVTAEQSLLDVWRILREHTIRRLPVVEDEDRLIGLVGRADLYRFASRRAVHGEEAGVRDLLGPVKVGDAMSGDPATCDVSEHLEKVSDRMRRLKVGAFPVLARGHLVGIISETDMLRALGELAGLGSGAERITLRVPGLENGERRFEVVDLCRRYAMTIIALLTHPILADSATMITLRVRGDRADDLVSALWKAGFDVVDRA